MQNPYKNPDRYQNLITFILWSNQPLQIFFNQNLKFLGYRGYKCRDPKHNLLGAGKRLLVVLGHGLAWGNSGKVGQLNKICKILHFA